MNCPRCNSQIHEVGVSFCPKCGFKLNQQNGMMNNQNTMMNNQNGMMNNQNGMMNNQNGMINNQNQQIPNGKKSETKFLKMMIIFDIISVPFLLLQIISGEFQWDTFSTVLIFNLVAASLYMKEKGKNMNNKQ